MVNDRKTSTISTVEVEVNEVGEDGKILIQQEYELVSLKGEEGNEFILVFARKKA